MYVKKPRNSSNKPEWTIHRSIRPSVSSFVRSLLRSLVPVPVNPSDRPSVPSSVRSFVRPSNHSMDQKNLFQLIKKTLLKDQTNPFTCIKKTLVIHQANPNGPFIGPCVRPSVRSFAIIMFNSRQ